MIGQIYGLSGNYTGGPIWRVPVSRKITITGEIWLELGS